MTFLILLLYSDLNDEDKDASPLNAADFSVNLFIVFNCNFCLFKDLKNIYADINTKKKKHAEIVI